MTDSTTAPAFLLHGIDTVQCACYLRPVGHGHIDFARLSLERERLRAAHQREPGVISLGRQTFHLAPRGSPLGFPLAISNADWKIEFGQYNVPPFFVTFRSEALWRDGPMAQHRKFLAWAQGLGYEPFREEGLSRVDFCFDYHLSALDFDEDSFVSLSTKDSQHRQDGRVQTYTFGRGDVVLRVYDKVAEIRQQSGKVWMFDLWGRDNDVWRIEWQIRKKVLRRFGLTTFQDLLDQPGEVLHYLGSVHDTLRVPTADSNRSRWPLHPLWMDLQARIAALDSLGVRRVDGAAASLRERKTRVAISIYGYLKRLAALMVVDGSRAAPSLGTAEKELDRLLEDIHDPMSWQDDVAKRVHAIQLGSE